MGTLKVNGDIISNGNISATSFIGNATSATTSFNLLSGSSLSGASHAEAIQTYFNDNQATIPRNALLSYHSNAVANVSQYFGYFTAHEGVYGGFYVAAYNDPYYVGIVNGKYSNQRILTSDNYNLYTFPPMNHEHAASEITSGTLSIARGGTGASSRLAAAKNLTNESISSPGYVVSLTGGWANFGYTTLAQLMTAMGAASATPSMTTASNNYINATFLKIGKLVICTILPKVADSTILYQEDLVVPSGYRSNTQLTWTYYSPTHKNAGGNGIVTLATYTNGNFRVLATYGTKPSEMKGTYCWITT